MTRRRFLAPMSLGTTTLLLALTLSATARAGLVVKANFDASITDDMTNGAAIQATITAAVAEYSRLFADPITVNITFAEDDTIDLAKSNTAITTVSYADYHKALIADAKTGNDQIALASLPAAPAIGVDKNPVDGGVNIILTRANARAVGLPGATASDATVTINTDETNFDRKTIDKNKYDLKAVVQHEVDEVLGLGSSLATNGNDDSPSPSDLFRYKALNMRSYDKADASAYFSIDKGASNLVNFSQVNDGTDFGDYLKTVNGLVTTLHVQDARGTPGATPDLGVELKNLDVIGYDLIGSPEPSTIGLATIAVSAGLGAWIRGRRRL